MTKTIEIYADTKGLGRCRAPECEAAITWAEVVKTGKKMCFNGDPVPLSSRLHDSTNRLIEAMDFEDNHWATCPARDRFRS